MCQLKKYIFTRNFVKMMIQKSKSYQCLEYFSHLSTSISQTQRCRVYSYLSYIFSFKEKNSIFFFPFFCYSSSSRCKLLGMSVNSPKPQTLRGSIISCRILQALGRDENKQGCGSIFRKGWIRTLFFRKKRSDLGPDPVYTGEFLLGQNRSRVVFRSWIRATKK